MDDFDYLASPLSEWVERFLYANGFGENTPNQSIIKLIESDYLPRYERELHLSLANQKSNTPDKPRKPVPLEPGMKNPNSTVK